MIVNIRVYKIKNQAPRVRIEGTVKSPSGDPLSRFVILYDNAMHEFASAASDEDGRVVFDVYNANVNELWTVRGFGYAHENDDLSPKIRGVPV